jgi:hypothetical protein
MFFIFNHLLGVKQLKGGKVKLILGLTADLGLTAFPKAVSPNVYI